MTALPPEQPCTHTPGCDCIKTSRAIRLCYLGQSSGQLGECVHDHTYNGDDDD